MSLMEKIEKFNRGMSRGVRTTADAVWHCGEDFGVGVHTSFSRFSRKLIMGDPSSLKDYAIGSAKIIGGSVVGIVGGALGGLEAGGISAALSDFGVISQNQAINFSLNALFIGAGLGGILGLGLYHASIGRKERHQTRDRKKRLNTFT